MNILFVCDWDFSLLWPKIANSLKAKKNIDKLYALIVGKLYYDELIKKSNSFEKVYLLQEFVEKVPKNISDIDKKLHTIEKQFSEESLWRLVWADRSWIHLNHEEIKKRIIICFDFFNQLIDNTNPDLIVTNAYGSMPHIMLYEVAKKRNIKMIRPMTTRMLDIYFWSEDALENETWIINNLNNNNKVYLRNKIKVENFLKQYRENFTFPIYQKFQTKIHQINLGHFYRFLRYIFRYWILNSFQDDHSKLNPFKRLFWELNWRIRRIYTIKFCKWDDFDFEGEYVYFPLQFQPEMSMMLYAPYYYNQISVIQNLAKSLPINFKLVVKEHTVMLGKRERNFYKEISKISNVILVNPFKNSIDIVKKCSLVFTITSTVGLEALILKKPVIALGSVYWKLCPLVFDAKNISPTLWFKLIKKALKHKHDEDLLIRFFCSFFDRSFRGSYMEPLFDLKKALSKSNLKNLEKNLISYMKLNKLIP